MVNYQWILLLFWMWGGKWGEKEDGKSWAWEVSGLDVGWSETNKY